MKYMGSKARFAKDIYAKVCEIVDRNNLPNWVEPFAGGMNMLCSVPDVPRGTRYANDSNEYLIAMFRELCNGWIPPTTVSREDYAKYRKLVGDKHMIGYAGFCCSYSGKWFGGYAGKVKTKNGTVRDYQDESFRNVEKQVKNLSGVIFTEGSFIEMSLPDNSVVYCDPPYQGTTKYANDFDHVQFWQWVRENLGATRVFFVSEYAAPDDFVCVAKDRTKLFKCKRGIWRQQEKHREGIYAQISSTLSKTS